MMVVLGKRLANIHTPIFHDVITQALISTFEFIMKVLYLIVIVIALMQAHT